MELEKFKALRVNHAPKSAADDELIDLSTKLFPSSIGPSAPFKVGSVGEMSTESLASFIDLIDKNIGDFYLEIGGERWKTDKWFEMNDDHLIFVWYELDNSLVAFLSFMYTESEGDDVLYLYEIHVSEQYHGQSIGRELMNAFHELARNLGPSKCQSTNLTVFSDNLKAYRWYTRLGYVLTPGSPTDKVLRSGKVRKPVYYLMKRVNA